MGDGYQVRGGPVVVGGNQDPCVFADPLGGLHSFCRVVKRKGTDNDVAMLAAGGSGLLPTVARRGDVVFYGKPDLSSDLVAVDTVLVVEETQPFGSIVARVGARSDAYAFNLSDARPGGSHAGEDEQIVIVARSEPTMEAVDAVTTSFVPFAERDGDGRWRVLRIRPSDLGTRYDDLRRVFAETMFAGSGALANRGRICEIPSTAGEALARAVGARSRTSNATGAVFVPPLHFRSRAPERLGGDGAVRAQAEHLARLA